MKDIAPAPRQEGASAAIASAARELFVTYGFTKTNVSDIAAVVGMSPANLYRHFRNKHAIGRAVVEMFIGEEATLIAEAASRPWPSAEAQLRAYIEIRSGFVVRHLREAPRLIELAAFVTQSEEGHLIAESYIGARVQEYQAIIDRGVAEGEFAELKSSEDAARAVFFATSYFVSPDDISVHGFGRIEEDLAVTLDLICAGLRAGPSRPGGDAKK